MTSRKRCVATCSTCKTKLQEIIETGQTDDLYLMSISLLPGVVKIGRSRCPTQRALQLQESSPFWFSHKLYGSTEERMRKEYMTH